MSDFKEIAELVHAIHTQTTVYESPDGEKYPYLQVDCFMDGGRLGASVLFNPVLTIGIMDAAVGMMKILFGAVVVDSDQLTLEYDAVPNFENMPPPPQEGDYNNG